MGGDVASKMADGFRSSRTATVLIVSLAIFVDIAVYGIIMPTLPSRIVDQLGLDASYVGILVAFYALGLILITPIVSVYSDKFKNRKAPMIMGLLGLIISTLAFAFTNSYFGLVMARFGQGFSAGISWTIGLAMISDIYPPCKLGSVMGYVLSANSFGFLVGPPLGGILSQYVSQESPYFFCTGLAVLDLAGRLYIKSSGPPSLSEEYDDDDSDWPMVSPESSSNSSPEQHNSSVKSFANAQVFVTVISIIISVNLISGIEPTLPIHLAQKYNLEVSQIGAMWLCIIIPNMISEIVSGNLSDKYGRKNITAIGLFLFGICSILLGFTDSLWSIIAALILFGIASGIAMAPPLPEFGDFAQEIGGSKYAQAYALYNVSYSLGMMTGPVIGGYLYQAFGFKYQMLFFGSLNILISPVVFYYWWIRSSSL